VIAYHVAGKRDVPAPPLPPGMPGAQDAPTTVTEKINCIYVADTDVISDQMFLLRAQGLRPSPDGEPIQFDNVTFALNCIDVLVGDTELIPLRTRRAELRTLETVEAEKKTSLSAQISELEDAETEFKKRVEAKQKQLDEDVNRIRDDKSIDDTTRTRLMQMAQEQRNEELEQENEAISREKQAKIREIRNRTEREIRSIEATYKWAGILLPPLPAILLGIFFLFTRIKNESTSIPVDRSRSASPTT
jgi:ABC-2 type transport system permease protein